MPTAKQVEEFKDQIVLIDIDNGMQLCTRIKGVENDQIICEDIILFQIATTVPDPSRPPGPGNMPEQSIQAQPLGGPFRAETSPTPPIDLSRVLFIHKPIDPIEKAYMSANSGIQVAGAGTLAGMRR